MMNKPFFLPLISSILLAACSSTPQIEYRAVPIEMPESFFQTPPKPTLPTDATATQKDVAAYIIEMEFWSDSVLATIDQMREFQDSIMSGFTSFPQE